LLAIFNWEDEARLESLQFSDFYLEARTAYYAREFWSGTTFRVFPQGDTPGKLEIGEIPAHGCALLAVRPYQLNRAQYIGSNIHISQGMEVAAWEQMGDRLAFCLERPGHSQGSIDLSLPQPPYTAKLNQEEVVCERIGEQVYRFHVLFNRQAVIELGWEKS
jgi:hypothetical protein